MDATDLKILLTDYVHHDLLEGLRSEGVHVTYAPEASSEMLAEWLSSFDGIIVNTRTPVRAGILNANPQLRLVGRLGVGLDIIDMDEAVRRGIHVVHTPGANANAVAEHCMGMLLGLLRHIPRANAEVKLGSWYREKNRGVEVEGLTIGIIGFGHTGSAFARKFAGWKTEIVAYDKYKTHYAGDLRFVQEATLEEVVRRSDVISLHVPLTDETRAMVDARFLSRCRRGVVLINASRGQVVDTRALVEALAEGQVGGACLDVLERENPAQRTAEDKEIYRRLFALDQVVLTPHIAGWTHGAKRQIARQMLAGIRAWMAHQKGARGSVR